MFTCNYNSTADPKGSDCGEKNMEFIDCLFNHPKLYGLDEDYSLSEDSVENQLKDSVENQSKDSVDSQSKKLSDNQSEDSNSAVNKKSAEMKS